MKLLWALMEIKMEVTAMPFQGEEKAFYREHVTDLVTERKYKRQREQTEKVTRSH